MNEFLASCVLRVLFATPSSAHGGNTTARLGTGLRLFRSSRAGQSCIICAAPVRNGERSTSAAPGSHSTTSRLG
jgi:hypothetical protein